MVECPICGKECSSLFYLGQHVQKKDDRLHNGEEPREVKETVETEQQGDKNIVDDWKENTEDDSMEKQEINNVPIPDNSENKDEYVKFSELDAENLTNKQLKAMQAMNQQGYFKIEKDFKQKPIDEVDFK